MPSIVVKIEWGEMLGGATWAIVTLWDRWRGRDEGTVETTVEHC